MLKEEALNLNILLVANETKIFGTVDHLLNLSNPIIFGSQFNDLQLSSVGEDGFKSLLRDCGLCCDLLWSLGCETIAVQP
ncbi:hypothetical protein ABKN59_007727 [Abortiporus biennis]